MGGGEENLIMLLRCQSSFQLTRSQMGSGVPVERQTSLSPFGYFAALGLGILIYSRQSPSC
jgi:hypothetical protein